jgi:Tol biopolymer transport system component
MARPSLFFRSDLPMPLSKSPIRVDIAMMPRATVILAAVVASLLFLAAPAGAAPASYKGTSADGTIVFFETADQLVPGDTDFKRDVYERSFDSEPGIESYVTRDLSLGPMGGNDAYNANFEKANEEGTKVFFTTEEALVEEDTDHSLDVYMREPEAGRTTLVSRGEAVCSPGCGNGSIDAPFAAASADGEKVFFVTQEKLTANDKDNSVDIYQRNLVTEETILVSAGSAGCPTECGNGPYNATLWGISHNGSYVYFTTEEALAPQDGDTTTDIYVRELTAGETGLVSQAAEGCTGCGNEGQVPVFRGNATTGTRVFFSTGEKLVGADGDGRGTDIYARDLPAGPTTLVSGGSEAKNATFAANSADGQHVFFNTVEPLLPVEDQDTTSDVYEWTFGGPLRLVTSAPCASSCDATFDAASADSQTVVFNTAAQLAGEDQDSAQDVYSQPVGGGAPTLVSRGGGCGGCGNGSEDARFDHASADAGDVVFTSKESLSPEDGDIEDDIYSRDLAGEATSLITTSPSYCPLKKGNCGATYVAASADGGRVFFTTIERFTLEDGDNESDVYERFLGPTPAEDVTRLVSAGNSPDLELGPPAPKFEGTNPVSPAPSTSPKVFGEAQPGSTVKLYTNSGCTGEPVAHGSATQFASPGVGVTVGAGETARFWATAEAEGFVSLCAGLIAYQQESVSEGEEGTGGGGGGGGGGGSGGGGSTEQPKVILPGTEERPAYVTPHTRITFAPASKTRSHNPTFRFKDSTGQRGTHFRCKVDRRHWKPCHSPLRLKKLSRGRHKLEIRAVNAVGVSEPHPAVRRFKVVPR